MKHLKYLALFFVGALITSCEDDFLSQLILRLMEEAYNNATELETAVKYV